MGIAIKVADILVVEFSVDTVAIPITVTTPPRTVGRQALSTMPDWFVDSSYEFLG